MHCHSNGVIKMLIQPGSCLIKKKKKPWHWTVELPLAMLAWLGCTYSGKLTGVTFHLCSALQYLFPCCSNNKIKFICHLTLKVIESNKAGLLTSSGHTLWLCLHVQVLYIYESSHEQACTCICLFPCSNTFCWIGEIDATRSLSDF